jgi:formate hydrogenlyase subunit 7
MAGYRYGRQIADQFMQLLAADSPLPLEQRIHAYLQQQDDLRLSEIVGNLLGIYQRVLRGELRL